MAKTSGGLRGKAQSEIKSPKEYKGIGVRIPELKNVSEGAQRIMLGEATTKRFKPFADVVRRSKSFEEAYDIVRKMTGVSDSTSNRFRTVFTYKESETARDAFRRFYAIIKAGS